MKPMGLSDREMVVEDFVFEEVESKAFTKSDCGANTGDPGFGEGNDCAEGRGSKMRGSLGRSTWEKGEGQFKRGMTDHHAEEFAKKRPDLQKNTDKTREAVKGSKHSETMVEGSESLAPSTENSLQGKQLHLSNGAVQPKNEDDFTPEMAEYYATMEDQAKATSAHNEAIVDDVASQLTIDEMHDYLANEGVYNNGVLWEGRDPGDWTGHEDTGGHFGHQTSERWQLATRAMTSGNTVMNLDWREMSPEQQEMYKRTLAAVVVAKERYLSGVDIPCPVVVGNIDNKNVHGFFDSPMRPYGPGFVQIQPYGRADSDEATISAAAAYAGPPDSISARTDGEALVTRAKETLHYKRAWTASAGSRVGTVVHEIGHALHYQNLMANENRERFPRDNFQNAFEALVTTHKRMRQTNAWKEVAQYLPSAYAQSDPYEYVAECFTIKTMHPDLWRAMPESLHDYYYDTLGGP